jgi:hypothetical protein
MDNLTLILIAVTNFFLAVILGLLAFVVYKIMRQNSRDQNDKQPANYARAEFHPAIQQRIKDVHFSLPMQHDHMCPHHPNEPGEVDCAICDHLFCRICIKPFKSMHVCQEHIGLLLKHEWKEILTLKTSTSDPEEGVRLYDLKKKLLEESQLPTYVETHYKINVDDDHIETYLVLFCTQAQADEIRQQLAQNNFLQH